MYYLVFFSKTQCSAFIKISATVLRLWCHAQLEHKVPDPSAYQASVQSDVTHRTTESVKTSVCCAHYEIYMMRSLRQRCVRLQCTLSYYASNWISWWGKEGVRVISFVLWAEWQCFQGLVRLFTEMVFVLIRRCQRSVITTNVPLSRANAGHSLIHNVISN